MFSIMAQLMRAECSLLLVPGRRVARVKSEKRKKEPRGTKQGSPRQDAAPPADTKDAPGEGASSGQPL